MDLVSKISQTARSLGEFFDRERRGETLQIHRGFRDLVEGIPLQLWVTRPDGYHEYFNERVLEYTGLPLKMLHGTRAMELIHPDDRPTANERWSRSLTLGLPYEIEYRLRAGPQGDYRWFLGRALSLRDERGVITRWLGTCTDIHDHKLLQERLARELEQEQRARCQLEQHLRLSETFTAMLGHDLRSPLNAIAVNAALLREDVSIDQSRQVAGRISTSARRMTRMVEQLLDLTRIRVAGGLPVRRAPMELAALCDEVIREFEIGQRRCTIERTVVADTRGCWDYDRLAQAASNLVGNAVRHGESGVIEISLDGRAADEVVLAVHNAGVIAPALMPQLFDPYRKGEGKREGLGLGLFITKQVVEAHGGHLWVCSSAHEGTSFHVRLPRFGRNDAAQSVALTGPFEERCPPQ